MSPPKILIVEDSRSPVEDAIRTIASSRAHCAVSSGSVLRVVLTGSRHLQTPIASLKKTGPSTYVLRPMHEHDDFGIELYAGDTIEIVNSQNTNSSATPKHGH